MSLGSTLRQLARLLDRWEAGPWEVTGVSEEDALVVSTDELCVEVTLELPMSEALERSDGAVEVTDTSIDDGAFAFDLSARTPITPPDVGDAEIEVEPIEATVTSTGTLATTVSVTTPSSTGDDSTPTVSVRTEDGTQEGSTDRPEAPDDDPSVDRRTFAQRVRSGETVTEDAGGIVERRNPDVPPFQDVEYLQAVYDAFDTFAEMADEIDMEVTSETVRRYMIDAGIHEPASYDTDPDAGRDTDATASRDDPVSSDAEAEPDESATTDVHPPSPERSTEDATELVADGIGLPNDVSPDEFVDVLVRSKTLYEVQRGLGMERGQAHELLKRHNLLDLVMGQLTMESQRNVTRGEVIDRLRENAST